MTDKFPWARLMHLGIGVLKIPPHQFWRCTLRELVSALGPPSTPLQRQNLNDLMRQWPDDTASVTHDK
jgi:uncharacterized phage protein (TIGR02216 family)